MIQRIKYKKRKLTKKADKNKKRNRIIRKRKLKKKVCLNLHQNLDHEIVLIVKVLETINQLN